jgi:hypothetical protein
MKKLPLSLVIVINNEENLLERALRSCADLVSDIIIVHDGKCIDKSLDIARKYTNNIFVRREENSSQPHRPFTYKKAKYEWILQLDADEYLSDELRYNLTKLISQKNDIYIFSWPTLYKGKYYYGRYKTALFKKNKIYLLGITHEYPKPINDNVIIKNLDLALIHAPDYEDVSFSNFKKKWISRAKIHARFLKKSFKNVNKWNYNKKYWDYPTNLRIKHPILFGIILSTIFHLLLSLKQLIQKRSFFMFRFEFYTALYFLFTFYFYKFNNLK